MRAQVRRTLRLRRLALLGDRRRTLGDGFSCLARPCQPPYCSRMAGRQRFKSKTNPRRVGRAQRQRQHRIAKLGEGLGEVLLVDRPLWQVDHNAAAVRLYDRVMCLACHCKRAGSGRRGTWRRGGATPRARQHRHRPRPRRSSRCLPAGLAPPHSLARACTLRARVMLAVRGRRARLPTLAGGARQHHTIEPLHSDIGLYNTAFPTDDAVAATPRNRPRRPRWLAFRRDWSSYPRLPHPTTI